MTKRLLSNGKLETLVREVVKSIEPITRESFGQATYLGSASYRYSAERLIELEDAVVKSTNIHFFEEKSLGGDVLNTIAEVLSNLVKESDSDNVNFDDKKVVDTLVSGVVKMIVADDQKYSCIIPVTGIELKDVCTIGPISFYPAIQKDKVVKETKKNTNTEALLGPEFKCNFATLSVLASNPRGAAERAANIVEAMLNAFQTLWGQVDQPRALYVGDFAIQRNSERVALTNGKGIIAYDVDRSVLRIKLDEEIMKDGYLEIIADVARNKIDFREDKSTKLEKNLFNANKLISEGIANDKKDTKFTKLMSAVESLVEEKTMSQSITTQVSENVAFLIGKDAEERVEIFDKMKKLYNSRSVFSHGGTEFVSYKDLNILLTYIRRLIEKIVDDFKYLNKIGIQKRVKMLKFGEKKED